MVWAEAMAGGEQGGEQNRGKAGVRHATDHSQIRRNGTLPTRRRRTGRSTGLSTLQRSWAIGQREWKGQPAGGSSGLGSSPCSTRALAGAGGLGIGDRRRGQQGLGVGMLRIAPDLIAAADLDQGAEIHDGDAVGDVLDHRQVVADEEVGDAELALEVLQQVDHLGAHRHVERRHRLVADDELGAERQRAGDADALALAAGEFVRIALLGVGRQADPAAAASRPARPWRSAFQPAMTSGWATERPTVERGLSEP